jgi:hypothetical protein
MKRQFSCATALILFIGAPQAAGAQIATGQSGRSTMQYFGGEQALQELSAFGLCYASQSKADALKLVAAEPGSQQEANTYRQLFRKHYQSCLGSVTELRVPPGLVRGAIAEGLYRKNVPVPADLAFSTPPERTQIRNLAGAARCYTAGNPEKVRSLIENTKPGSESERIAVDAIMGDFGGCIPPGAKRKLELDTMTVRYRLAEALWRLTAPRSGVSGKPQ